MYTNNPSFWCPLLLAAIISVCPHVADAIVRCGLCEIGTSLTCPNTLRMQYEVSVMQHDDDPEGFLLLKCNYETPNLNFTWLEGCSFPSVQYVRIQLCPLFNEPIGSVLRQIGVNEGNVRYLVWENAFSVENGLHSWHLEGLSNLTTLHIQNNYFTSVPREFLKHTPLLTRLVFNENIINELPDDIFSHTPALSFVELGNNHLTNVSADLLVELPQLSSFALRGNDIALLPKDIFRNNSALDIVDLSSNKLEVIEGGTFQNLKHVHTFNLRINMFVTLHESVFSGCSNLSTLYLTYNSITYLPPNIFKGTKLTFLYMGYNKLENISVLLNDLPTLENVTLHKNNIRELLGNTFKGSYNLVRLDLQFNSINFLASGIFDGFSKLRMILLNNNDISQLPSGLYRDCNSLRQVYMQENNISDIPLNTFPSYSNILLLDLSHNNLKLNDPIFNPLNKLTSIERLYLSNNKIDLISNDYLHIFTKLKILDLNYNSLTVLKRNYFNFLSSNVTLLVQHNNISSVRTDANLEQFGSKKTLSISLSGNPLSCDCSMYQFLKAAQFKRPFQTYEKFNLLVDDARESLCSSPEDLNNISIDNVDYTKLVCAFPCSDECACLLRQHDMALLMNCSQKMISASPNFTQEYVKYYETLHLDLDLSGNNLDNVDFLEEPYFSNMVKLNLVNNSLSKLSESSLPPQLATIDLRDNNFTSISPDLAGYFNQTDVKLYLGRNPWKCDCELKDFYLFIRDNYERVLDRSQVVCKDNEAPVQELTLEQLCPILGQPAALGTIAGVVLILLIFTILITMGWYRHKEIIKVWLYTHNMCLWAVTEQEIDADKKYDAFVSYSYKDESFVNNTLVPGLESGDPPYKVCLHYRDWVPGEFIADQIMASVNASRRTIVVLSKNFLDSVWGQMEFKAAHRQALKDKTNRIIVIIHGDLPGQEDLDTDLKLYVTTNTYLKWGDQRFWERLRYAMPHAKYAKYIKKSRIDKLEMVKSAPTPEITSVADGEAVKTVAT